MGAVVFVERFSVRVAKPFLALLDERLEAAQQLQDSLLVTSFVGRDHRADVRQLAQHAQTASAEVQHMRLEFAGGVGRRQAGDKRPHERRLSPTRGAEHDGMAPCEVKTSGN